MQQPAQQTAETTTTAPQSPLAAPQQTQQSEPKQPTDSQLVQHKTDIHTSIPAEVVALEQKHSKQHKHSHKSKPKEQQNV